MDGNRLAFQLNDMRYGVSECEQGAQTMNEHFTPVTDSESLDELFASSAQHPVILFKHDPYCPISARAYKEMAQVADDVAIIDVEHNKEIASAITKRTGVQHESPQVIVVKDGQPVWSASQFNIKANAVSEATHGETPTVR